MHKPLDLSYISLLHMLCFFTDLTHLAREKAKADADFYRILKDAEANKVCIDFSLLILFTFESKLCHSL